MKEKVGFASSMLALFASAIVLTSCCCDWNPCCEPRARPCCPRKQLCCPTPHCMDKPECCDPSSYQF